MIHRENINQIWASLMVEECLRNGLDTFFLAPGSRCTPLTMAVARNPEAHVIQHFDERGLGFVALGYARATGRPGVVITTSGTAVSNLLPAVVEAGQDGVPMLLLTADRPPELRDCGANQSVDQIHHFGRQVEWFFDLPCPTADIAPSFVLSTVDQAVYHARRGPVHLNCMFREPLAPIPDATLDNIYLEPLAAWMEGSAPQTAVNIPARQVDELNEAEFVDLIRRDDKVLVLAGGGLTEAGNLAVIQLAEEYGWPVLADVTSGMLFGPHRSGVVRHEDAILTRAGFSDALRPTVVVQFGVRFVSKGLKTALAASPPRVWLHATDRHERLDPEHQVTHRFVSDVDRFCMQLQCADLPQSAPGWRERWLEIDSQVAAVFEDNLDDSHTLSEPAVARVVSRYSPNFWGLVASASMPVRDLNQFAATNLHQVHVASNRGASGIDGTIATAVGFARGLGQGCSVLIGDLAMLHDLNSLALVAREPLPLVIVVVNNDGGGIFHFLPVARYEDCFEKFFATPHGFHFEHAARMFGLEYEAPRSLQEFANAYRKAVAQRKSVLIEVETDRKANQSLHKALQEALSLYSS